MLDLVLSLIPFSLFPTIHFNQDLSLPLSWYAGRNLRFAVTIPVLVQCLRPLPQLVLHSHTRSFLSGLSLKALPHHPQSIILQMSLLEFPVAELRLCLEMIGDFSVCCKLSCIESSCLWALPMLLSFFIPIRHFSSHVKSLKYLKSFPISWLQFTAFHLLAFFL